MSFDQIFSLFSILFSLFSLFMCVKNGMNINKHIKQLEERCND